MELQDLFPIVIIGGLIQVGSQIYFIYHCWNNDLLSNKSKIKYTILLALFNLPVAAIYLLSLHKKIKSQSSISESDNLNARKFLFQGIFILILIAFLAASINILAENSLDINYTYILYLVSFALLLLFVLNSLKYKLSNLLSYLLSVILIISVSIVNYLAGDFNSLLIVLSVVAALINYHNKKIAVAFSILTLVLYMSSEILRALFLTGITDPDLLIGPFYVNIILIVLVFASFFNLKKYIESNDELNNALISLREQSLKIEEMSAIAERNKIAGEIHDNVGHELTTAIITIESGIKDISEYGDKDINNAIAVEKFFRARDIIRGSLESIRTSVKTINSGKSYDFISELEIFIDSVRKDTGLQINLINEAAGLTLIPLQSKLILQSIRECITNVLKHSESSQVDILISKLGNFLFVSVSDNGKGTENFVPGFGLNSMKKNIESFGGTFFVESSSNEGFNVQIKIPVS